MNNRSGRPLPYFALLFCSSSARLSHTSDESEGLRESAPYTFSVARPGQPCSAVRQGLTGREYVHLIAPLWLVRIKVPFKLVP